MVGRILIKEERVSLLENGEKLCSHDPLFPEYFDIIKLDEDKILKQCTCQFQDLPDVNTKDSGWINHVMSKSDVSQSARSFYIWEE